MPDPATKRCRVCGVVKPLCGFYRRDDAPDGYRSDCQDCVRDRVRRHRDTNREEATAWLRSYRARLRALIFGHYGTACACCGTAENLTIDHVNGVGAQHRLELYGRSQGYGGPRFYAWLARQGFPAGYATLCRPCNSSKRKGERCRLDHAA